MGHVSLGGDPDPLVGAVEALGERVDTLTAAVLAQGEALLRLAAAAPTGTAAAPAPDASVWERLGLAAGERRTVTVLFADVSGFTALAETLDPEQVQLVMRDVLAGLAGCITRLGGEVEKFIGDAVCAIFGAPVAYPDEPQRAACAAMAMHQVMAERTAGRPDLPPLAIHAGINTGTVVAGGVGDGSQFGVMGDTINVAARLMGLAVDGETFVSAETGRRIRRDFALDDRGTHELKGKALPVSAFAVVRQLSPEERAAARPLQAPFVGRAAELARLRALAAAAAAGDGAVVAVVGDDGLGSTRLAAELADAVRGPAGPAFRVLGASARVHAETPLGLVAGALHPVVAELGPGPERAATEVVLAGGLTAPHDFELALGRAVVAAARRQPLLIVLDDANDADPGSVEVVRYLARVTADEPVLWVLTGSRVPVAFDAAARGVIAGSEELVVVALAPLDDETMAALFEGLLPGALEPPVRARLAHLCEGNPEFAEELALALVDRGVVVECGDGRWAAVGDVDAVDLPDSVADLVEARIECLGTVARATLQDAAVIGLRFGASLLARIATAPATLDAALSELTTAELVEAPADDDAMWRFRSRLVRDVAYESVLRRRRAATHHAVADALLALEPARVAENADLLAHHLEHGDDPPLAVPHLLVAIERAERAANASGAAERAERGLRLHDRFPDRLDDGQVVDLHLHLGTNELLLGDPAGHAELQAAVDLLEESGAPLARAVLAERVGWHLVVSGDGDAGVGHLRRAQELAAAVPDDAARAGVLAGVATTRALAAAVAGDPRTGLAAVAGAVEEARAAGDAFAVVRATTVGGVLRLWEGQADEAAELLWGALDASWREAADPDRPGGAMFATLADRSGRWLVGALVEAGSHREAWDLAHPLLARADDRGDPSVAVGVRAALAELHRHLGDPARAVAVATEALAVAAVPAPGGARVIAPDAVADAHLALATAALDVAAPGAAPLLDPGPVAGPALDAAVAQAGMELDALVARLEHRPWLAWRSRARAAVVRGRLALLAGDPAAAVAAARACRDALGRAGAARERLAADLVEGLALVAAGDAAGLDLLDAVLAATTASGSEALIAEAADALVVAAAHLATPSRGEAAAVRLTAALEGLAATRAALG
ncbi:MAG: adenylate/guanylate cyclase domain-containing protein [Acidimicrobiales bacterium]